MTAALKTDPTLRGAVDTAREAAVSIAEAGAVGEHLGMEMVEDRLATHYFTCTARAYLGWRWAVSVARVPRAKTVTVCEANLVPGEGALLSPDWVPYAERLAPGDVGPGDVTPLVPDDPNLEPGFEATGDEDVDRVGFFELGLGRPRVLSAEGREAAAQRWYDGESGPSAPVAVKAPAPCSSCGFFVPMAGALRVGVRGLRQRVVALRRPRRQPRPRVRCALRGRRRPAHGRAHLAADPRRLRARPGLTASRGECGGGRQGDRFRTRGEVTGQALAALSCPRPTNHQANAPRAMPVTQVHGHQDRSPVWKSGTTSVTTSASTHSPMPTPMIGRVGTASGSTGADGPEGREVLLRAGLLRGHGPSVRGSVTAPYPRHAAVTRPR